MSNVFYNSLSSRELGDLNVSQLRDICRFYGIRNYSDKKINDLVKLIRDSKEWKQREKVTGDKIDTSVGSSGGGYNYTLLNETRDDIWSKPQIMRLSDILIKYTKQELIDTYNESSHSQSLGPLTTTWLKRKKEEIIDEVRQKIRDGVKINHPPRPNLGTIPKIPLGTIVYARIPKNTDEYSDTRRSNGSHSEDDNQFIIGMVLSQNKKGEIVIKLYESENSYLFPLATMNQVDCSKLKLGTNKFSSKPIAMSNYWRFSTEFSEIPTDKQTEWRLFEQIEKN